MLNLTWIFGILVSTIVFGTLIGLTLNYSNISKKNSSVVVIAFCAAIIIFTYFISLYENLAYNLINQYNIEISLAISFLMFLIGFYLIKKGKPDEGNNYAISKLVLITIFISIFVAVTNSITILSSLFGLVLFKIGTVTVVLLILVSIFYLSQYIIEILMSVKISLLGKIMILIGLYYLASAVVVPNINSVLNSPVKPMNITSITTLTYMVILVILLMVYGFYRKKRQNIRTR